MISHLFPAYLNLWCGPLPLSIYWFSAHHFSFHHLLLQLVNLLHHLAELPFHFLQDPRPRVRLTDPMLVLFEVLTLLIFLLTHHELIRLLSSLWPLVRIILSSLCMELHQPPLSVLLVPQGVLLTTQSQRTSVQSRLWTKPVSLAVVLYNMWQLLFQAIPQPILISGSLTPRLTSNALRHWKGCSSLVLDFYNNRGLKSLKCCWNRSGQRRFLQEKQPFGWLRASKKLLSKVLSCAFTSLTWQ